MDLSTAGKIIESLSAFKDPIKIIGIASSIFAAAFWYISAKIPMPNKITGHVVKPHGYLLGTNPSNGTYMGHIYSKDVQTMVNALNEQSKWSARAALFATISAICTIGT